MSIGLSRYISIVKRDRTWLALAHVYIQQGLENHHPVTRQLTQSWLTCKSGTKLTEESYQSFYR